MYRNNKKPFNFLFKIDNYTCIHYKKKINSREKITLDALQLN